MAKREVGWGRERSQHQEPHRKYLLRRALLRLALPGPVYVPFIGDGDIAAGHGEGDDPYPMPGLYLDRDVYGADLDADRVAVASSRLRGDIRVADCDTWPFKDVAPEPFAVADFDAWADPYPSFRSFWRAAPKADRVVMFFTDARRISIMGDGLFIHPDGSRETLETLTERRDAFNKYLAKHVWPWFEAYVLPYRVTSRMRYSRGLMVYWGAVVQRQTGA